MLFIISNDSCVIKVFGPGRVLYLLFTGQALTLHGVLIVDGELAEELPATLQCSVCPRHRTLTLRDELHVLHGLRGMRGVLLLVTITVTINYIL